MRTLVVACATLAILFVVFSMYQFSQSPAELPSESPKARLPSLMNDPVSTSGVDPSQAPSASIGGVASVGPGRDIRLTIYPREGTRARMEVEVRDWTPRRGSANEFLLVAPVIRLRTNDGHAVRVSAGEGILEAEPRSGGSLDPRRGRLSQGVVVEYDRIPEKQRSLLPPPQDTQPLPADLVRVELDEVEFDLEYGKLTSPGEVHLTARDASLVANGLDVRFGEHDDRLESMRILRGGRIEIAPESTELGRAIPGLGSTGAGAVGQRQTVAEWLWQTLQHRLGGDTAIASRTGPDAAPDASATRPPSATPGDAAAAQPSAEVRYTAEGVPIFRSGGGEPRSTPRTESQYHATFRTKVSVEQRDGDAVVSRLTADELDIVRPFTEQDRSAVAPSAPGHPAGVKPAGAEDHGDRTASAPRAPEEARGGSAQDTPRSRVVVEWTDQLVVDALAPADPLWSAAQATTVTATGAPVRLWHQELDATCSRFTYEPDSSRAGLLGTESTPVQVKSTTEGTMSSVAAVLHRTGQRFAIQALGPGELRPAGIATRDASIRSLDDSETTSSAASSATANVGIRFGGALQAEGRLEAVPRLDLSGHVATEETRLLERATFTGGVAVRQEEFALDSDELALNFGVVRGLLRTKPVMEMLRAKGHAHLTRQHDRITCDELDARFQADRDGRIVPQVVTGRGDVTASQGDRSIFAKDELAVEFGLSDTVREKPRIPPVGARSAEASDVASLPGGIVAPSEAPPGAPVSSSSPRSRLVARRVRATGDVTVADPKLEARAARLDCTLDDRQEIESALVNGEPDAPATIRSEGLSATGQQIEWFAPEQRAEIPGQGRLTLRSRNDLNGRRIRDAEGVPVVVSWTERMRYDGRANQAQFIGKVHATSEETSTFDCDRLTVEFEPVVEGSSSPSPPGGESPDSALPDMLRRAGSEAMARLGAVLAPSEAPATVPASSSTTHGAPRKQVQSLLASGNAVAVVTEMNSAKDQMRSRLRLSGPRLSANLRPDIRKMRIEGAGDLLIEDFQERADPAPERTFQKRGLLTLKGDDGPSKTLIRWSDSMQYDFSLGQTRFEGDVELKFLSGEELDKLFQRPSAAARTGGRFTHLQCDTLTADFLGRERSKRTRDDQRIGLSSRDLRQFEASGAVQLQDETEGLSILADRIIFEQSRQILFVDADPPRKARLVKQQTGQLPYQVTVRRLVYNLETGQVELSQPTGMGH